MRMTKIIYFVIIVFIAFSNFSKDFKSQNMPDGSQKISNSETSYATREFGNISENVKIVPENLQTISAKKSLEFKDSKWPEDINNRKVDSSKVPEKVLDKAVDWMRIMIRNEWIPDNLKGQIIGIRKQTSGFFIVPDSNEENKIYVPGEGTDDYLIVRYEVDGYKIQVQENSVAMAILIDPNDSVDENQEITNFMADVIYKFLNYPEEKRDTMKFNLQSFSYENKMIYFGTIDCDFDISNDEARSRRIWWNHSYVWTDGKIFYISLVERDGKPRKLTQSKPGIPARFD